MYHDRHAKWFRQIITWRVPPEKKYFSHLASGVIMQLGVVGDELHNGVPDLLGGELACPLNELQADIHIPFQAGIEPAEHHPSLWSLHGSLQELMQWNDILLGYARHRWHAHISDAKCTGVLTCVGSESDISVAGLQAYLLRFRFVPFIFQD